MHESNLLIKCKTNFKFSSLMKLFKIRFQPPQIFSRDTIKQIPKLLRTFPSCSMYVSINIEKVFLNHSHVDKLEIFSIQRIK